MGWSRRPAARQPRRQLAPASEKSELRPGGVRTHWIAVTRKESLYGNAKDHDEKAWTKRQQIYNDVDGKTTAIDQRIRTIIERTAETTGRTKEAKHDVVPTRTRGLEIGRQRVRTRPGRLSSTRLKPEPTPVS
jgi:hypothetical protein